jgi:alkylation response protein AidB-like acyl-CoA dehydrogenase
VQAALAFTEPQARFDVSNVATTARQDGDRWILNGKKTLVLNGGDANLLIVPARNSGGQSDPDGITLFALASDAEGVDRKVYKTVDAHGAAEIGLREVAADQVLGTVGDGYTVLRDVIDDATLAVAAEASGIMRVMHDKTVDYSKQRIQFGVPVGSFQALQHRMVDTLIACEQTRSLLLWAAMLCAERHETASKAVSALKYQTGSAGRRVAAEAVQIHGGMGVTWELDIAHYFKRMTAIDTLFGNADYHLDRYSGLHPS